LSNIHALLLAAGAGTRLRPFTDNWPKCLMPISGRPLLEYWLCMLKKCSIPKVIVNIHHHQKIVEKFLGQPQFESWVSGVVEPFLLGTAGTLRENWKSFKGTRILLVHADNWCQCDISHFIDFHMNHRPSNAVMTMMTFQSDNPKECGILELDDNGLVQNLHEKVEQPPGTLANGAVYLLEPEILDWVMDNPEVNDFSTEVIPNFFDRIATWENTDIHRDIGKIASLRLAQLDRAPNTCWHDATFWHSEFQNNPIHDMLASI
tara:strand:+ start:734 stop:1519 length:786 start_codon:yes stop_codon:yes gene_type:complete